MPPNFTQKASLKNNAMGISFPSSRILEQSENDKQERVSVCKLYLVTDSELVFINAGAHFVQNS